MRTRVLGFFSGVLFCSLAFVPSSFAATQIGQACTPFAGPPGALVQLATTSPPSYAVPPGGGVITSWRAEGPPVPGWTARLKLFRSTGFSVVGESATSPLAVGVLNEFPTRIPVEAGDLLGAFGTPGTLVCVPGALDIIGVFGPADPAVGSTPPLTTVVGALVDVAATVEPDADKDGFGDETQDQCPTNASTQGACPAPPTPPTPVAAADTTPAKVGLSRVAKSMKRKTFLRKGIRPRVSCDEPCSLQFELLARARGVRISRSFNLTLATRSLGFATGKRSVRLKASKRSRRLIRRARRFKLRLKVTATDRGGNQTVKTKSFRVK